MNNTDMIVLTVVVSVFGLLAVLAQREFSRGRGLLEAWCAKNQFLLLNAQRGPLYLGLLFFAAPNAHRVFRIEVADASGSRRAGYADFRHNCAMPLVTWDDGSGA